MDNPQRRKRWCRLEQGGPVIRSEGEGAVTYPITARGQERSLKIAGVKGHVESRLLCPEIDLFCQTGSEDFRPDFPVGGVRPGREGAAVDDRRGGQLFGYFSIIPFFE